MQTSNPDNFFRTEADLARTEARALKYERNRLMGDAIHLKGKILSFVVTENDVWTAESGAIARRTALLTGKTKQIYRGHAGPVTCLQILDEGGKRYLITGSWDQTIKVWDTNVGRFPCLPLTKLKAEQSKEILSNTSAHADFLKNLLVIPSLQLLISGSSDKRAKIWDLEPMASDSSLSIKLTGVVSGHTRPVDCLAYDSVQRVLYTGDSMGVIKAWNIDISEDRSHSRATQITELKGHRTGVNSLSIHNGSVWSASTDKTVAIQHKDTTASSPSIEHPEPVKCALLVLSDYGELTHLVTGNGENISIFDVSSLALGEGPAEPLGIVDAHSHDVTSLAVWRRQSEKDAEKNSGLPEIWIVSGSLDGTVRKWSLAELISSKSTSNLSSDVQPTKSKTIQLGILTEEEEKELDELMRSD